MSEKKYQTEKGIFIEQAAVAIYAGCCADTAVRQPDAGGIVNMAEELWVELERRGYVLDRVIGGEDE